MLACEQSEVVSLARFFHARPPSIRHVRVLSLVAGLLHGLLMACAFAPIGMWFFAFLAPIPLGWIALVARDRPLVAGFWAGVGTLPFWALAHHWIVSVSSLGFFPLAVYLAAMTMLLVWGSGRIFAQQPALLLAWPLLWVGFEFFRGVVLLSGYPWYLLAHPLADATVLNYLAPIGGTFLVSGIAALPSTAVLAYVARMHRLTVVAAAGDFVFFCLLGFVIHPWPSASGSVRLAIVQTNVPQSVKTTWSPEERFEDWTRMRTLIAHAVHLEPQLIALPEAMFPGMTLDAESFFREDEAQLYWSRVGADGIREAVSATLMARELMAMQQFMQIPVLIGGASFENLQIVELDGNAGFEYVADARFNAAFVVDDGLPPTKWYNKVHLTPFGETMPVISRWKWLEAQLMGLGARGMRFDLAPGKSLSPLEINLPDGSTLIAGTPICFEATTPWVCRRLGRDSDLLINLTNDGWFGAWNPGREHHLLTARWRAIELGKPLVRVANTGISCVFDERGRELIRGAQDPETGVWATSNAWGVCVVDVPTTSTSTFYARIGDIFGWMCFFGTAGAMAWTYRPGRSRRRNDDSADEL